MFIIILILIEVAADIFRHSIKRYKR